MWLQILKNKYTWIVLALLIGGLFGRYLSPIKVEEREKVVEKIVKQKEIKEVFKKQKRKVIIRIKRPDGTIEERIEWVEDTDRVVDVNEKTTSEKLIEKEKIVKTNKDWHLSALVANDFSKSIIPQNLSYGAHIQRQIVGPISVGVWGLTSKQGGVSLGVQF